jgi:hypothetical protein
MKALATGSGLGGVCRITTHRAERERLRFPGIRCKLWALIPIAAALALLPGTARAVDIVNNWNGQAVSNCPAAGNNCALTFTLTAPTRIDQIETYHWNNGVGEKPNQVQIILQTLSGVVKGRFPATGSPATNGALANWTAKIGLLLSAGQYTIIDSKPATWSQNAASGGKGFTIVSATAVPAGGLPPAASSTPSAGSAPAPAVLPKPIPCTYRNGFAFLCYGDILTVSANPIGFGTMLTLTVPAASPYSFDASTVIVLEPLSGVGLGVGLRTLCGGLSGGAAAPACPLTNPKTMTLPIPAAGVIPPGYYKLSAENWEPSIVVGGAGVCTPGCTEADAGVVQFTGTVAGSLQITGVTYPDPTGQIAVGFADPPGNLNQVQVLPWTGFQWGNAISWNPGTGSMTSGQLFIRTGCTKGRTYTIMIILSDATPQSAQQKFTYTCK